MARSEIGERPSAAMQPGRNSWERSWPAPAKINLFLHVNGRRADGYHLLQTVFRFLDFGDALSFAPRGDGKIVSTTPIAGVPSELDLTVRAARLLQQAANISEGADITLSKRLPIGGGLGGGSSDAATVLIALNWLWHAGLSRGDLQQLGLKLGADVPIFIHGRAAFAEGIGERFSAVTLPEAWYLVLESHVAVSTATIFASPLLRRDTPRFAPDRWRPGDGCNDLEAVACRMYPEVARNLEWLARFGRARMSGSGGCVFAEFPDERTARAALLELPAEMSGFIARGLDQHPLLELT